MSATSSRSSSFEYEDEPEPQPPCRPWKYLEHPDAREWTRGPLEIHQYPNLGDFVFLVIDPIASVAHLDAIAKQSAKHIPRRKYVALSFRVRLLRYQLSEMPDVSYRLRVYPCIRNQHTPMTSYSFAKAGHNHDSRALIPRIRASPSCLTRRSS